MDKVGGRKTIWTLAFLGCSTFLVNAMLIGKHDPDFVGMATVIGAISVGLGGLVYGNIREHQAKNGHSTSGS